MQSVVIIILQLLHTFCNLFRDYSVLSEFTIALLEDSGWYKANYSSLHEVNQNPLQWGRGEA